MEVSVLQVLIAATFAFFIGFVGGYLARHIGFKIHEHFIDEEEQNQEKNFN